MFGRRSFGRWHRKPWQLPFQLLFNQSITLINPDTIWGVIIFIIRTHMKYADDSYLLIGSRNIQSVHNELSHITAGKHLHLNPGKPKTCTWNGGHTKDQALLGGCTTDRKRNPQQHHEHPQHHHWRAAFCIWPRRHYSQGLASTNCTLSLGKREWGHPPLAIICWG